MATSQKTGILGHTAVATLNSGEDEDWFVSFKRHTRTHLCPLAVPIHVHKHAVPFIVSLSMPLCHARRRQNSYLNICSPYQTLKHYVTPPRRNPIPGSTQLLGAVFKNQKGENPHVNCTAIYEYNVRSITSTPFMSSDAMVLKQKDNLSPVERETEAVIGKELPIHIKSQVKLICFLKNSGYGLTFGETKCGAL